MRALVLLLVSALVVTCGQKGPLELPEKSADLAASASWPSR
jgi:predicted small lipoprotein YifL